MSSIGPLVEIGAPTPEHRDGGAVLADPRSILRALAPGSQLAGTVIATTTQGHPQIATAAGLLTLEGTQGLSADARVVIRIVTTKPTLRATLQVLPGNAASPPATAATASAGAAPTATSAPVLEPLPMTPGPPHAPDTTPTTLLASSDPSPPLDPGRARTAVLLTPMPWRETPPASDGPDTHVPARERVLSACSLLPMRIEPTGSAANSEHSKLSLPAALFHGARLAGVVTAGLPDGRIVVTVPGGGQLLLAGRADVLPGQAISLVVAGLPLLSETPSLDDARPRMSAFGTSPTWMALDEACRCLEDGQSGETRDALRGALPRLDAGMREHARMFFAALRDRDVRAWLGGRAIDRLADQRPDLLARIGRDFEDSADASERASADGWSSATLPVLVDGAIEPIRMFYRRNREDRRSESEDVNDRRLVIDLTFSRLGRVQVDTLVHSSSRRLDVIVRSEHALSPQARDEIRSLVGVASELSGVAGGVGFRTGPSELVDAPSRLPPSDASGVII
jgi:hypothetical protein